MIFWHPYLGLWGTASAVGAACSCYTSPSTGAHQTKPWFRLSNCLTYPRTLVWEQITSHVLWNRFLQHLCMPSKQGGWQNHHHCLISIFWVQSLWKGISSSSLISPLWNRLIVSGKPSRRERKFSTVGLLWLLWPTPAHQLSEVSTCSRSCPFCMLSTLSVSIALHQKQRVLGIWS